MQGARSPYGRPICMPDNQERKPDRRGNTYVGKKKEIQRKKTRARKEGKARYSPTNKQKRRTKEKKFPRSQRIDPQSSGEKEERKERKKERKKGKASPQTTRIISEIVDRNRFRAQLTLPSFSVLSFWPGCTMSTTKNSFLLFLFVSSF